MKEPQKLIFLVDDNEHILNPFSWILEHRGYLVEKSSNAYDAIKRIEGGLVYNLLIVDREMPGIREGGDEIARRSKIINPKTPIIAISAYEDNYNRKILIAT